MITVYHTKPGGREKRIGDSSGSYAIAPIMKSDSTGITADVCVSVTDQSGGIVDINIPGEALDKINAFLSAMRATLPAPAPAQNGGAV